MHVYIYIYTHTPVFHSLFDISTQSTSKNQLQACVSLISLGSGISALTSRCTCCSKIMTTTCELSAASMAKIHCSIYHYINIPLHSIAFSIVVGEMTLILGLDPKPNPMNPLRDSAFLVHIARPLPAGGLLASLTSLVASRGSAGVRAIFGYMGTIFIVGQIS